MEKNKKVERSAKTLNRKKMKRVLAVVLSILMVVSVADCSTLTKVSAQSTYGTQIATGAINPLTWTAYDSDSDNIADLLVISGTGAMTDKSSTPTGEAYWAYSGSIKNIVIEDGVTKIGDYAFDTGFGKLTTVTLADTVTTIGKYAFRYDYKLADLVLGTESQLKVISDSAFYVCISFADQDIFRVNNLQTIGNAAFWSTGFNNTTIVLPATLTSYNTSALNDQIALTLFYPASLGLAFNSDYLDMEYVIENGGVKITKINSLAANTTIHLPETLLGYPIVAVTADRGSCTIVDVKHNMVDRVCQICGYAQRCGDNIFYEYADGVLTLFGSGAMYDYSYSWQVPWNSYMGAITKVVIPSGITSIGSNAFYGASSLTDIELEEGSQLTAIHPYAFENCTSLSDTDIFIKARLQTIKSRAFCQTAYSGAVVLPSTLTSIDSNSFSNVLNVALIFPAGLGDLSAVGAYMGYTITNSEATITTFQSPHYDKFPNGILLPEAIDGNKLVAVTASHSSVTLKDVNHNIVGHTCLICGYTDQCGDNVFYSFENGVLTLYGSGDMYDYAYGATPWISLQGQITKVIVGKDITSIGAHAFSDCYNLECLVLESGSVLQKLESGCFLRASKLSDVVLPETVNYIDGAFQDCTNATVYYPEAAPLVFGNSFRGTEGFVTYKMMNGKKYITSPTANMIMVPENLAYTGEELRTFALDHIGIWQYADGITVNGTNFGVDIDETKWVKSVSEISVIDIDTYTAKYTGTYFYSGGSEAKVISKSFSVVKGNGSGTVTLEGWNYGETAKDPIPTSVTNGIDNVTYEYKIKGEDDSTYSATKPVNPGTYTVKATFAATANYSEAVATVDFTIEKLNQTALNITEVTGKKYDDIAFTLETTGGNGTGGVMYSVPEGNGVLSISGNTATIIGAGTVTVTATKVADNIYNSITATREITIGKADTTIELNPLYVDTYAYTGTALAVPIQSDLAITGASYSDVTFTWYSDSVAQENRLSAAPSAPGIYVLVASIAETANTNASSASITVTINFFDSAVTLLYNGSPASAVWYTGDVTLTAAGFTISDSLSGTYVSNYTLTGEGSVSKTLYFKQDGTGYITDGKTVTVNIDKTLPAFSGETDGITISDNHWKQFLNQVTFGHFFKETKDVSISAMDSGSGVAKYYYYIDTNSSTTTKTTEELNALSFTEATGGSFSISDDNKYVVYAYVVDFAGNKSAYICTDGIVLDKTAPTVTLTEPAGSDIGDISATANVQMNETGTITYVVKTSEQSRITAGDILNAVEKKTVSVTDGQVDTGLDVEFSGLTANTTYHIYAVGTDSTENNSNVANVSFTTIKAQPVFAGNPTITGTYGQQVGDMTVSQVTSTNGVVGSWSVADSATAVPSVGASAAYDVIFTPDDTLHYATVTVQVIPTVNPKNLEADGITIGAVSSAHTYDGTAKVPIVTVTDSRATITASDYEYSYSNNTNAGTATVTVTGKDNYAGMVNRTFTIAKAPAPSITYPTASDITYGQKLSESTLSGSTQYGTFAWKNNNTVPIVANSGYEVTFTPNANTEANYEAIANTTDTIAITVSKVTPVVTVNAAISEDAGSRNATLTVAVTGVGDGEAPDGTVKFVNSTSGSDVNIKGATTVTITDGKTTFTWIGLANQIYKIKAVYSGSGNYNTATSTELTIVNEPAPQGGSSAGGGGSPTTTTDTTQSDAGTPVIKDGNKAGWEVIQEQIRQAKEGDTVTIEMNGSLVVPREVLGTIRGTDTTLVFDMGDGITWSVNGQSITDNGLKDINFGVTMDTDAIPENLINQVAEEQDFRSISLSHDGEFGFSAVLSINLEKKNAGLYANLFYYNPATKQLELQSVGKMNENGYVDFMFAHASDYVVTISKEPMFAKAMDQIVISAVKGNLYVGGTEKKSMTMKLEIPDLLKEATESDSSKLVITYQSSNPNVATVSKTGKIIAKKPGKTIITTLVTINGVQKSFKTEINVSKAYIKLLKSTKNLKKGKTFTFQAKGYGVNTQDITFCTSKKSIVVINKTTGKAVATSTGTDYVIAKVGDVEVKIKVKVL